jgi:uncharacterized protein YeaO (DUF488 family)
MIYLKRAYDEPGLDGGQRFLVDRLWPRGVKKEDLLLADWLKNVAPSEGLRRWFGHDLEKWPDFQKRYREELDENPDSWRPLLTVACEGNITLVYGARDTEHNNAVVLKAYLEEQLTL